jgi:hypothetical protein
MENEGAPGSLLLRGLSSPLGCISLYSRSCAVCVKRDGFWLGRRFGGGLAWRMVVVVTSTDTDRWQFLGAKPSTSNDEEDSAEINSSKLESETRNVVVVACVLDLIVIEFGSRRVPKTQNVLLRCPKLLLALCLPLPVFLSLSSNELTVCISTGLLDIV